MSDTCNRVPTGLADGYRQALPLLQCLLTALLMIGSGSLSAHEYWLEPVGLQWRVGDQLQADIRNGQDFVGTAFPFDPESLARAGLISDSKRLALQGRLGDYPAFQMQLQEGGLHLLLLETTRRQITYKNSEAFEVFLNEHSLNNGSVRHRQRALPETNIIEHYYRYCKALISVASASGINEKSHANSSSQATYPAIESPSSTHAQPIPALQPQGQPLELVVAENPLGSGTVSVRVLFQGVPLADRQVELFHRNTFSTVTKTMQQSDDEGFVHLDIAEPGDYLLNSVWIEVPTDSSAHWKTSWASLFFQQNDYPGD